MQPGADQQGSANQETLGDIREEILAPTAPRICSACPTCLEECDPQEGPGHPLQSQAERNLLCRERATYLHSKQVAADGKSVRYGSVINCCNCRLYLAQGAGAGGPGHSSSIPSRGFRQFADQRYTSASRGGSTKLFEISRTSFLPVAYLNFHLSIKLVLKYMLNFFNIFVNFTCFFGKHDFCSRFLIVFKHVSLIN